MKIFKYLKDQVLRLFRKPITAKLRDLRETSCKDGNVSGGIKSFYIVPANEVAWPEGSYPFDINSAKTVNILRDGDRFYTFLDGEKEVDVILDPDLIKNTDGVRVSLEKEDLPVIWGDPKFTDNKAFGEVIFTDDDQGRNVGNYKKALEDEKRFKKESDLPEGFDKFVDDFDHKDDALLYFTGGKRSGKMDKLAEALKKGKGPVLINDPSEVKDPDVVYISPSKAGAKLFKPDSRISDLGKALRSLPPGTFRSRGSLSKDQAYQLKKYRKKRNKRRRIARASRRKNRA